MIPSTVVPGSDYSNNMGNYRHKAVQVLVGQLDFHMAGAKVVVLAVVADVGSVVCLVFE